MNINAKYTEKQTTVLEHQLITEAMVSKWTIRFYILSAIALVLLAISIQNVFKSGSWTAGK